MKKLATILTVLFLLVAPMSLGFTGLVAADSKKDACNGINGVIQPDGSCKVLNETRSVEGIVKAVIQILGFAVGAASVIMIIVSGIRYVTSGGDSNAISGAKNTLMYAVVGLVVALMAEAIARYVFTKTAR